MEDREIIELYLSRDEKAITETDKKYGDKCNLLAFRILNSKEDSSEAVNDTFLKAWNTIPPNKPERLFPYLAMLCRQISIDRLRKNTSIKRGGGEYELSLEELENCIPDTMKESENDADLTESINRFLDSLPKKKRVVFIRRYFWLDSVAEIAEHLSMSEGSVKMILLRVRESLKKHLESEGFTV